MFFYIIFFFFHFVLLMLTFHIILIAVLVPDLDFTFWGFSFFPCYLMSQIYTHTIFMFNVCTLYWTQLVKNVSLKTVLNCWLCQSKILSFILALVVNMYIYNFSTQIQIDFHNLKYTLLYHQQISTLHLSNYVFFLFLWQLHHNILESYTSLP